MLWLIYKALWLMLIGSHNGENGSKIPWRAKSIDLVVSVFHQYPPFKTVGTDGIRPGGLPRWLELLTKLAAILDLGT